MTDLQKQIELLEQQFTQQLNAITTIQDLEQLRVAFTGRSGHITVLMDQLKQLSLEQKKEAGPRINAFKASIAHMLEQKKEQIESSLAALELEKERSFDVTAYNPGFLAGRLHIYTSLIEQLENIFLSMGFDVVDGPEVDNDHFNFQALNISADHPARDAHDTFWLNVPGMLMRTHTSNVQAHCMKNNQLPMALFAPGRCYRNEATDATHDFMFTQGECLLIDTKVSVSNLLATAKTFLQQFFNKKDLAIRVRPGYFPFVEPGLEIDATCPFCTKGCSVCKKTTWIELLGAGMIHPNVLKAGGIDPEKYQGFAFGFGIERLAMIKYQITDVRLFHGNKMEFLKQF